MRVADHVSVRGIFRRTPNIQLCAILAGPYLESIQTSNYFFFSGNTKERELRVEFRTSRLKESQ